MSEIAAFVKQHKAHRVARFGMLHLFPDRIIKSPGTVDKMTTPLNQQHTLAPEWFALTGVTAEVQQAGGVSARATLARSAVPGMHGWQKEIDTREAALVVQSPYFYWRIPINGKNGVTVAQAQAFAASVSDAARRQTAPPAMA